VNTNKISGLNEKMKKNICVRIGGGDKPSNYFLIEMKIKGDIPHLIIITSLNFLL